MNQAARFRDTIERLEALHRRPLLPAKAVALRRIQTLLRELDNPHLAFHSVHIAGSSGKGSTTTMVASILQAAGFVTGSFRSPHLFDYTERIAVDGQPIAVQAWIDGFEQLWPLVERMESNRLAGYELGRPSHGEVLFALMALEFKRSKVEWAAVEVGLGGRLDATNVLQSDVAVITNISLEHTQLLGDTVEEIAAEKAAIVKAGSSVVTAASDPAALRVITDCALACGTSLLRVDHEIQFHAVEACLTGQRIRFTDTHNDIEVQLGIAGTFQARNAATAFAVAESLRRRHVDVPLAAVTRGLASVRMPGRLEVIEESPLVLLDGAHNPAAARELARSLDELVGGRSATLVFAAMSDKDIASMAQALSPGCRTVIVTSVPNTTRGADPETVATYFRRQCQDVRVVPSTSEAIQRGKQTLRDDALLVVAGSLYLVGWARHSWHEIFPDSPSPS